MVKGRTGNVLKKKIKMCNVIFRVVRIYDGHSIGTPQNTKPVLQVCSLSADIGFVSSKTVKMVKH